jgi:phosphatidylglycerophosphate synthase
VTLANAVTGLRLALVPALVACILADLPRWGSLVFAVAVASDFADDWLARRRAEASALGGALDHGVDALLVCAASAALAWRGVLPAPLPALVAAAFLQYALGSRTPAGGLWPSRLGRWNGIAYYVAVAVPLVRDALSLPWPGPGPVLAFGWVLVASTLISMASRLRLGRRARGSPGAGSTGRSPR